MKQLDVSIKIRNNLLLERRTKLDMSQADLATAVGINLASYAGYEGLTRSPFKKLPQPHRVCVKPGCEARSIGPRSRYLCGLHERSPACAKQANEWRRAVEEETWDVEWRQEVHLLADFFDVEPDSLFPPEILAIKESRMSKQLDVADVQGMLPSARQMFLLPDAHLAQAELKEQVEAALSTLTKQEREVLEHRFGLNGKEEMTLQEIGESKYNRRYSVTKEPVRRVEDKALRKLRHPSRSLRLKPFVEE